MIDNSWAWASRRGKIRTNPVHKREEAKLVLEDWFEKKNETGEDIAMSGSAVLEDRPFTSMGSTLVSNKFFTTQFDKHIPG